MNGIDETTVEKAVALLRQAAPGATIILFGSHARGDAGENSDLDFLVIEPALASRREEAVRLRRVLVPLEVPVDVLVASQKTYAYWAETPGTVYYEAATEGRVFEPVS